MFLPCQPLILAASNCLYPLSSFVTYNNCSPSHTSFCLSISAQHEPTSFKEANSEECWRRAMEAELQALEKNQTWSLVRLPEGKRPVGCKWVYRVKYKVDGSVERYKARLVAKGFTQTEGVDYFETFSPVVKLSTVRFLLSLAAAHNWFLHQLDVDNAFLHGDLFEEVYMKPPPGFKLSHPRLVCKLHKSLYGLKQASRQWNQKLTEALISLNFIQSSTDHSLFIKKSHSSITALLVYVDDVVLTGNDMAEISAVKAYLHAQFHIKDLGPLKFFLGLEIARSQSDCKPVSTPIDASVKLYASEGLPLDDPTIFRRLIGRLLYLTNTRPDISFAVQQLSQFVDSPRATHFQAALRILRYLKSSPALGLFYP
uniref:Retrovirus-related Pol polyprotein from transposon TNT 1-94 n=1 Tax=Cajanus cajan TaxID=3821 RepID=A0A151S930_CAJCA|nr:Retrovirus-related Pol polyprotein from transposon TNT 1-94 [Cajanus cajan]